MIILFKIVVVYYILIILYYVNIVTDLFMYSCRETITMHIVQSITMLLRSSNNNKLIFAYHSIKQNRN